MPGGKLILIRDSDKSVIAKDVPTVKTALKMAREDAMKAKVKGTYTVATPKVILEKDEVSPPLVAAVAPAPSKETFE